jgi:hypothetical protein
VQSVFDIGAAARIMGTANIGTMPEIIATLDRCSERVVAW